MKKKVFLGFIKIFFIVLLIVNNRFIYAENGFNLNWNIGDFSIGLETPNITDLTIDASVCNIFIQHYKTGIGLFVSPFRYHGTPIEKNHTDIKTLKDDFIFTFANLNLNYDFLKKNPYLILGPFAEVNVLGAKDIKHYEFSAGFQFFFRYRILDNNINLVFNILNLKTGYKLVNNRHKFFFQAGVDITGLIMVFGSAASAEAKRKKDPYTESDNKIFKGQTQDKRDTDKNDKALKNSINETIQKHK